MNLSTPLFDAALKPLTSPRRFEAWEAAKQDFADAIEAKHILNVVFTESKETLSRGVDTVLRALREATFDEWRIARRDTPAHLRTPEQERIVEAHDAVDSHCQLNHAAGKLKKYMKYADVSSVATLLTYLAEVQQLHLAVEAAKPFVVKGRRPSLNPIAVDISNTAHCAICGHCQKLSATGTLVHHGYTISSGDGNYFGYRSGSCFGVSHLPYEVSSEANEAYLPVVERQLAHVTEYLRRLNAGEVETLVENVRKREGHTWVESRVIHARHTYRYRSLFCSAVSASEFEIAGLQRTLEYHQQLIKRWTRQPTEDELHPPTK